MDLSGTLTVASNGSLVSPGFDKHRPRLPPARSCDNVAVPGHSGSFVRDNEYMQGQTCRSPGGVSMSEHHRLVVPACQAPFHRSCPGGSTIELLPTGS